MNAATTTDAPSVADTPSVACSDLRVVLGGAEILRGIDMIAKRATLLGLVGPNGAGKSTLLRTLAGLIRPTSGDVRIDGRPVSAMTRRQVARTVHLLPQSVALELPFTVRDVVAMGRHAHLGRFQPLTAHDHDVIDAAMDQTHVVDLAGRPITELSGGERQRVLLARSLATEAPVLLLDEPTTSLDILHQLEVLDLLNRFAADGKTVVAALHDLALARRYCHRILLVDRGRIAAAGAPDDALRVDRIEEVFGVRARLVADGRGMVFSLPDRPPSPTEP